MNDDRLISLNAAIEAVNNMIRRKFGISADLGTNALLELPSATDTNVATTDTISRAAALKELEDLNIASFYEENEHSKEAYTEVKAMLKALPSAQPERDDCDTCKHHGYFGSVECNNCRMRYPSYWESREGGHE